MKNNKAANYLLIAVLIIVWGIIIYRVIQAYSGDDTTEDTIVTPSLRKEPLNDYSTTKDTTRLMLNYRDPFAMGKPAKDTVKEIPLKQLMASPVRQTIVSAAITPQVKPAINWSFITYTGYIRNPSSKKVLAMVHINGKELMMSEGETAEQVRLVKNLHDSIKVAYQGKTKFITMNAASL